MSDQNQAGQSGQSGSPGQNQSSGQNTAGSTGGSATGSEAGAQGATAPERPKAFADKSFDGYFDAEKGVNFDALATDLNTFRTEKAANDLRLAGVPAKADDYKLALPQTFELPKGPDGKAIEFAFDETDPRVPAIRDYALKHKLDQAGFSDLLAIHAQHELGEMQMINNARAEEQKKLGVNGPARVDATHRIIAAQFGTDSANRLLQRMVLADDFADLEKIANKLASQGHGNFNQQHRDDAKKGAFDEEAYQKSGPPGSTARLNYMKEHGPQSAKH